MLNIPSNFKKDSTFKLKALKSFNQIRVETKLLIILYYAKYAEFKKLYSRIIINLKGKFQLKSFKRLEFLFRNILRVHNRIKVERNLFVYEFRRKQLLFILESLQIY